MSKAFFKEKDMTEDSVMERRNERTEMKADNSDGARVFVAIKIAAKLKVHGEVISKLISSAYYVDENAAIVDLAQDFSYGNDITAVAVVDSKRRLLGIVARRDLFDILGKPYGRDVMKHKNVARVMTPVKAIDKDRNIYTISSEMEKEFRTQVTKHFAIVDTENVFCGFFTSRDMLIYLSDITQKDIELARLLQMSIVKERMEFREERYRIGGATKMAKGVGGDFYDVKRIGGKKWLLSICDVSGKGVAASLVTTSISGMYSIYDFSKGVAGFISSLNGYIANSFDSQKFVTGIFVEYDEETAELNFYDMGHSYIYIYRHSRLFRLKTNSANLPLGVVPELDPAMDSMTLEQGDLLILITDGIAEQVDPSGAEYGDKRIASIIRKNRQRGMRELMDAMYKDLKEFRASQPQHDDMTMILLDYRKSAK